MIFFKNSKIALSAEEFHKIKGKAMIIDVRTNQEFAILPKIKEAHNIYVNDLLADPTRYLADRNQLIVTYCNAGNRSSYAATELRAQGYQNTFYLGQGVYGYQRWNKHQ